MRVTVVAGDRREGAAAAHLAEWGHRVSVFGRPEAAPPGVCAVDSPEAAFSGAEAVLGPALGTTPAGDALFRPDPPGPLHLQPAWLALCRPGTPWLVGRAGPWLRREAAARGLVLHAYAERDDFAHYNAVPTAEGAIAEAGRLTGRTAWRSRAVVVGPGRCGRALALRLSALGASVVCAARGQGSRPELRSREVRTVPMPDLPAVAGACDWLFNTVPARVITPPVLAALPSHALILDLASRPGGTDFEAAAALGVRALLLPGVPGRMYPQTAGRIVARVALDILGVADEEGGLWDVGI